MNLRQMRFVCEIVERDLSISRAAEALHTSQPSVSRQIQDLEQELGFAVFRRSRRRILGVTQRGSEVIRIARSMMQLSNELSRMSRDEEVDTGDLTIAASHAYAVYSLPAVVARFAQEFPNVKVVLRQSTPGSNAELVRRGEADVMISAKPLDPPADLVFLPCRQVQRLVLAPRSHPLARIRQLTLEQLARYPLITYDREYEAHSHITSAFAAAGLKPDIVLTATDVSVMKAYVKHGLGLAIVASIAYDAKEDASLCAKNASHLFEPNTIYVGLCRGAYLPSYVYKFISMFEPDLTMADVRRATTHAS